MVVDDSLWRRRLELVGDFFANVTWLEDPRKLYQSIADELVRIAPCDTVNLRMLSVAGDELIGYATSGSASSLVSESYASLPLSIGRMPELVAEHKTIVYNLADPVEDDVRADYGLELGYSHAVTVPMLFEGNLIGAIDFIFREEQFAGNDDVLWLEELCRIIGSVMGLLGISDRMTDLRVSDEARRIGIELHDRLAQPISVVALEADKALMALDEGDERALRRDLKRLRESSLQACNSVRQESLSLYVSVEESEDLAEEVKRFVARFASQWGIEVVFNGPDDPINVTKNVGDQVVRILNEALGNVLRHAHAAHVTVSLERKTGMVSLCVEDDGGGFDMRTVPAEKMGLRIMKERAARVGGKLAVASVPGEGTSLVADIPLSA